MNGQENEAELAIMSAVMIILSILGIIAGFSRGLFGGIDGLLILGVALMILLIFSLLLLVQAKEQGWIGKSRKDEGPARPPAAAKYRLKERSHSCLWGFYDRRWIGQLVLTTYITAPPAPRRGSG